VLFTFITCYSEVPWTIGHVTDIRETSQDGTTTQVSIVVYEMLSGIGYWGKWVVLVSVECVLLSSNKLISV